MTTGVAGKGGLQAMSFDGSDDYIDISGIGTITLPHTFTAWVKKDTTNSGKKVADHDYNKIRGPRTLPTWHKRKRHAKTLNQQEAKMKW